MKLNITIDGKTYEVDVDAAEPEAPSEGDSAPPAAGLIVARSLRERGGLARRGGPAGSRRRRPFPLAERAGHFGGRRRPRVALRTPPGRVPGT